MAMRGRFGRLPRAAPSLVSTIVALAQQYQGQRDRNIETAWKEGGLFEGKPVTDEIFLNHWKGRLASVDPQDPMWDYYNNLIHTYEFTIAESKIGLQYAEGKVDEAAMKAFYQSWAKKLPKDSEAYRQLMTQAAKFKSAAGASGRGSGRASAEAAYYKAQQATFDKYEAPFATVSGILAKEAFDAGLIDRVDLYGEKGNDWRPEEAFLKLTNNSIEDDPMGLANLLNDLQADPTFMDYVKKEMARAGVENWTGSLDIQTLTTMGNTARNGATIRGDRAEKAGKKEETTAARKAAALYGNSTTLVAVALGHPGQDSFVEQNDFQRSRMDAVLNDPNATSMQKDAAMKTYGGWLAGTGMQLLESSVPPGGFDSRSDSYNPTAAGIKNRVEATIAALEGRPTGQTAKDDLFGQSTAEVGETSDAAILSNLRKDIDFELTGLANGTAIMVQTDGRGNPTAGGQHWQIFARDAPEIAGNKNLVPINNPTNHAFQAADGSVAGGGGGDVRYYVSQDVKIKTYQFRDPVTGAYTGEVNPYPGMDPVVGQQVTVLLGGVQTTVYGTYVNGHLVWGTDDPMATGVTPGVTASDGSLTRSMSGNKNPAQALAEAQALETQQAAARAAGTPIPPNPPTPMFNPQDAIAPGMTNSPTTNPNFDPNDDYQNVWDSPFGAVTNSSSPHGRFVKTELGNTGMASVEYEWYRDPKNWTPQMHARVQASGAVPGTPEYQQAVARVIGDKVRELPTVMEERERYGYTPEDQSRTRATIAREDLARTNRMGALEGVVPGEFGTGVTPSTSVDPLAVRADLASQLDKWGQGGLFRGSAADVITAGMQQPGEMAPFGGLPKGWSGLDLLSQPGMSIDAARQLAFQISKGQVGGPTPGYTAPTGEFIPGGGVTPPISGPQFRPDGTQVPGGRRLGNAYLPKPGQLPRPTPRGRPYPTAPGQGPVQSDIFAVQPTPRVTPAPPPEPIPLEDTFAPVPIDRAQPRGRDYGTRGRTPVLRGGH